MLKEGARARLHAINDRGDPALGMFVGSTDAAVTEVAASAGFDFVVIDCEHSPMDPLAAVQHVRAAEAAGILPFARVWDPSQGVLQRFLDIGCEGIVVPHVESAEQVELVVAATRLPPLGARSTCPVVRGTGFSGENWDDYIAWSQANTVVIPIVESAAALQNVEKIAAVDGVDLIYLGAVDLAAELGVAANGPELVDAWLTLQHAARRHGKRAMGPVFPGVDQSGAGAFVLGMDLRILRNASVALIASVGRDRDGRQRLIPQRT